MKLLTGICKNCNKNSLFYRGLKCRECSLAYNRAYNLKNREKLKEKHKLNRVKNSKKRAEQAKEWRKVNSDYHLNYRKVNSEEISNYFKDKYLKDFETINKRNSKYRKNNPDKHNAKEAKRRSSKINATPKWLSDCHFEEIEKIYTLAKELEWLGNEPLHVDHIVPLQGKNVCGLHVPWNLQILPKSLNLSKKNKHGLP